eukprot:5632534-Lingulodinium_polyedra.AAC.1
MPRGGPRSGGGPVCSTRVWLPVSQGGLAMRPAIAPLRNPVVQCAADLRFCDVARVAKHDVDQQDLDA